PRGRGPGVIDMQGGDILMFAVLEALRDAGALDRFTVTVFLTGDEENAGRPLDRSRKDLVEAASRADVALGFENAAGDPRTAVTARRSASSWLLRVHARPGHSSRIFQPEYGAGAVFEAARILEAFRDSLAGRPSLT